MHRKHAYFDKNTVGTMVTRAVSDIESIKGKSSNRAYKKNEKIDTITLKLNSLLEKMILKNPGQWIWSHNRWK